VAKAAAAIGCRAHSGWAVMVAVTGSAGAPVVLGRRRIELLDGVLPTQPYHAVAASYLSRGEAAELITGVEALAATRAAAALAEAAAGLRADGFSLAEVAVVVKDRRLPDELDRILASHALLHAAEGELYEEALAEGALLAGLLPRRLVSPRSIHPTLEAAGRALGAPWQKDHKMAAAAAASLLTTPT